MTIRLLFTLATLFAGLLACGSTEGPTELRVKNASTFDLEDVRVQTIGPEHDFGDIPAGTASDYQTFAEGAYRYGLIETAIGGQKFKLQPVDYVGESLVGEGRFTYELSVSSSTSGNLALQFIED